jgi:hypothetical protein
LFATILPSLVKSWYVTERRDATRLLLCFSVCSSHAVLTYGNHLVSSHHTQWHTGRSQGRRCRENGSWLSFRWLH